MGHHIVVGVEPDHLSGAANVVRWARALAPGAQLTLATTYPDAAARRGKDWVDERRELRHHAFEYLQRIHGLTGGDARLLAVGDRDAAGELQRIAAGERADLLVVGSARRTGAVAMVLGDTGRSVLRGAPCPVVVVPHGREPADTPRSIGVAFDRSPEAVVALERAVAYARSVRGTLRIVAAVQVGPIPQGWDPDRQRSAEDLRRGVETRLAEMAADLHAPATSEAHLGAPRDVLGAIARDVDLIICGSRGWGPLARVTLGSTSDWLIHHAPCPVMVVPRGAVERPRGARDAAGQTSPA